MVKEPTTLEDVLEQAKNCSVKGRLYIYEKFKRELQELNLSPYEYEDACRQLAKYLEV